jgi:DNA invertase Pin-like site-specific DNA recombinase
MRVISYTRVSTEQQAEGYGLATQEQSIKGWAKTHSHKIVAAYSDEGISGSNGLDTRPGLAQAFRDLEAGQAEALVVYRLDRLARKLANQETWIARLESHGRKVISVTEPEYGDDEMRAFVRQVLGAVSEYERAVIVKRMQAGRATKASRGGYAYGSPVFGTRSVNRELVLDESEAATVARIMELHASGQSTRQIAAQVNSEGRTSKRGGIWSSRTISRVIARSDQSTN